jgi:hypothetical protein
LFIAGFCSFFVVIITFVMAKQRTIKDIVVLDDAPNFDG